MLRGSQVVVGGRAEGEALVTRESDARLGRRQPGQGVITETHHELRGVSFKDKVLVFRGAKGSSGWSAMYHTARLAGTAPKALVFNEMTTKVALGAVVMRVPSVTDLDRDPLDLIETGDWVIVDGDLGIVEIVRRAGKYVMTLVWSHHSLAVQLCFRRWLQAQEVDADRVREAAARALAPIQKAQAPWYTTNKQVCASCHHQYQPALAYRVARDHRRAVGRGDRPRGCDRRRSRSPTSTARFSTRYVIEPAVDDAYRMVAANAAGVKPNLGAAIYARLLISRQNARRRLGRISPAAALLVQPLHHGGPWAAGRAALSPRRARRHRPMPPSRERARSSRRARRARPKSGAISCSVSAGRAPIAHDAAGSWRATLKATQRPDGGWNSVNGREQRCLFDRRRRWSRCTMAAASRSSIRRTSVASRTC